MLTSTLTERVTTGALDVEIRIPAVQARGAMATAAGYAWQIITDDDAAGDPRVRVICHGRRISAVFDRWQYPRADVYTAVGRAAVAALTGARTVSLAHVPAGPDMSGYVGRAPVADSARPYGDTHARFYAVTDLEI
ncbi:hypothetical protein GoPhGRU1p69 [Gordonia phage GRU1]|uniref:Uncharacterized protein n=1 Tax=Gordonia phage GRU1 TaxID=1109710 RepID=G8EK28_9CAUD|nr:hypothetical protein GoPhGRU1p69 [Gordonia phage GRU1]AET09910.1 hypothetical protein [Gordonia phage GRU1]